MADTPAEAPQPIGPDIAPVPSEAPYPEIVPDPSPMESPASPDTPDNGRPYA